MTIQTHTTDRKALAQAIAEALHTEYRYLRTPTYAYEVGGYTIDRYGNITGDDFAPIHDLLVAGGYITPDAEGAAPEVEATAAVEDATEEAVAEEAARQETAPEDLEASASQQANTERADDVVATEGAVSPEDPAETETANTIGAQTITIPAPDISVKQLQNLTYILYSRQHILNLMTGSDTICIPLELIEALQEALPAEPEDFTRLLDCFRELGLRGFDFRDGQFTLTFPFHETEPVKWTTYAGLQGRILQSALTATRVFPELIKPTEEAEKYTAHTWLQRLGYRGPEMKEQRSILLKHLHGYCAFANGEKMENHKNKYGSIRREHREAEHEQRGGMPVDSEAQPDVNGTD